MSIRKRLEIIVDTPHVSRVQRILDKAQVSGYTLVPHVLGKGERGERLGGGGLTEESENGMIIVACAPDKVDYILDRVRPLLSDVGGVCMITECEFLDH